METKRSVFSANEKVILLELVEKYQAVIENEKSDCVTAVKRKKAWAALTEEFNGIAENSRRSIDQLRKCWENIKTRRKKQLTLEKTERMATGGGYYTPPKENDPVDAILSTVDIELKDVVDSDSIYMDGSSSKLVNTEDANGQETIVIEVEDQLNECGASITQPKPLTDPPLTSCNSRVNKNINSRGTAIERVLQTRLSRLENLRRQDDEFHLLRMEEQRLKVIEQQLKIEEQQIRNEIAKEELNQLLNKNKS